jgi:hypothetical protein
MVKLHLHLADDADAWIKVQTLSWFTCWFSAGIWELHGAAADQAGLAAAGIAAPSDLQEIFDGCC